jgi:NADH:ubiquinone reductase (H+-translocating)
MSLGREGWTMAIDPVVAIVGAGFAGLNLAQSLADQPVRVHLIDRHNYHTFQPLLYQVATGFLESNSIANNVRAIFQKQRNFTFTLGEVSHVDYERRCVQVVTTGNEVLEVAYDFLALATGVVTDFFGIPGAIGAFTLKGLDDATRLRNHVFRQFELVDSGALEPESGALTFAIVGGGSTGVELAGALSDLFRYTLARQFHDGRARDARIILIEAQPRLLQAFHPESSDYATRLLEERGVIVRLGQKVRNVHAEGLTLVSGERIKARTVVWVAGVRTAGIVDTLPAGKSQGGRVVVGPDLRLRQHPEVFVIGDAAAAWDQSGRLFPQVAPVAVQQGRHVARQLQRRFRGSDGEPFDYVDRGMMSTIGRNAAIAELPLGLRFHGYPAWTMWLGLHLIELIGFRNRTNVLLDWGWNYLTHHQGAGLMQCEGMEGPPGT